MFELRLLGPVQVARAGCEVALGGPKQRAVLALLLLDAGRVVPAERLVEELWRGAPPPGAAKTLNRPGESGDSSPTACATRSTGHARGPGARAGRVAGSS